MALSLFRIWICNRKNSMNYEITLAKQFGKVVGKKGVSFKISGTGFYTELNDAIVRELGVLPNEIQPSLLMENHIPFIKIKTLVLPPYREFPVIFF